MIVNLTKRNEVSKMSYKENCQSLKLKKNVDMKNNLDKLRKR